MQQIVRPHKYIVDIAKPLQRYDIGILAAGDQFADEFRFIMQENGVDVRPSVTMTVTAYFMRQDGKTVLLKGVHSGSVVSVTLDQVCYAYEGRFTLTVRVVGHPNAQTTLAMIDGFVRKTTTDDMIAYVSSVPKPEDFFSDEAVGLAVNNYFTRHPMQLVPVFANSVEECTDTEKVYVLPDGYVYAYMWGVEGIPEIIYEEKANGYWYANEYNPAGTWTANSGGCSKRTNVIPVTPGDQLKYIGSVEGTPDSVVWLDAQQKYISDEKHQSTAVAVTVTAPANAAYVWFGSFAYTSSTSGVILNVEWVKCQNSRVTYHWTNTGHKFVAGGGEGVSDVLAGKKIVYDGDSIAADRVASGGAYARIIADVTGGTYVNQAVGGGLLTASNSVHSVVNNLTNLPLDGDLYCFEGGINDYWGNVPIGTCTYGDYTGTLDKTTICGAMETIFRYALDTFVGKPVCFVIVHKVQKTGWQTNSNGNTFKDYRDAMVMVCEKYSIPYYDAFTESGLNGWNNAQNAAYLTANGNGTGDGIHPNEEGYRRYYVPQLLALFRSMMKV